MCKRISFLLFMGFLLTLAAGCEKTPRPTPSQIPTAPLPTRMVATISYVTPVPRCIDQFYFTETEDYIDGSVLQPGQKFVKEWEIMNNGSCDWTEGYSLRFISGDQMGAPEVVPLPRVKVGERGKIIVAFYAPETPGSYRSSWKAFNRYNQSFGNTLFTEITVEGAVPADSTPGY